MTAMAERDCLSVQTAVAVYQNDILTAEIKTVLRAITGCITSRHPQPCPTPLTEAVLFIGVVN